MIRSIIASLLFAISLSATVINVPADQSTIQAGIDVAVDGDTVLVQPGTYIENINFNGKNIELTSADGASSTIIQSSSGDAVITGATDSTAALIGFTITSAELGINAGPGGSTRFEDLIIQNCGNRGIYLNGYTGKLINVRLENNESAGYGGASFITNNSDVILINCVFSGNYAGIGGADAGGGAIYAQASAIMLQNCLIFDNYCTQDGGGIYVTGTSAKIFNSTITLNTQALGRYGAGIAIAGGDLEIINSIVHGNYREQGVAEVMVHHGSVSVNHSCVGPSLSNENSPWETISLWPGTGNINTDPLFVDQEANDFHLQNQSLCLGNGIDTSGVPTNDIVGENRPQPAGSNPDMGAYEHTRGRIPLAVPDRFSTIQAGIDASFDGDTVLVQPGTYVENINFNGKNIVVGSLFLTTQDTAYISQTIIDGNGLPNVVSFINGETSEAQLTGFTIQGGYYDGGNSAFNGAGILIDQASPLISHCTIQNNWISWYGGGICVWRPCSPVFNNLIIKGNTANNHGGGIAVLDGATPKLSNSLVINNTTNGGWGGGIYVGGTAATIDISNTTIANNSVTYGYSNHWGGGIATANMTSVSLVNSIVWGNNPNQLDDEFGQTHNITYSNIEGGYTGTGNIHSDPLFVNQTVFNYHILANSLCVNSGYPDSTDSDGTIADMGSLPYINEYSGPDWYVSTTGNDEVGTGESDNPFASIQSGINFVQDSESVLVFPGSYNANINFGGKSILVQGIEGAESTILMPENPNIPIIQFSNGESQSSVVDGFSLENSATYGGALRFGGNSEPTVRNCIITNTTAQHPISFYYSGAQLINCLITDNEGYSPIHFDANSFTPKIINCTFSNNNAPDAGVAQMGTNTQSPLFINCVMWNEGIQELDGIADVSYSIVQGGYTGTMVIDQDPYFLDESNGDYRLHNYSPGIGAGTGTNAPISDILGNPRPSPAGSSWDIGAYENSFGTPQHMPITINVPSEYATIQTGLNAAQFLDTILVQSGTYNENIIWPETNGLKLISAGDSSNTIVDGGGSSTVIYMNPQSTNIDTSTLIQGISIRNGGNVSIGGGIFISNASPKLKGVIILNNTAFVDGGGMYLHDSSPLLTNVTVMGNTANFGGGIMMITSSPTLLNVNVTGNSAHGANPGHGAGMYLSSSSPELTNVLISQNQANQNAGGMYLQFASPIMMDVTIIGNSAANGGGIYCEDVSQTLENATISDNTASNDGGGLYCIGEGPILRDLVVERNTANYGGGLNLNASPQISNLLIRGNVAVNQGGGIYWYANSGTPSLSGSIIVENNAEEGGGLYLWGNLGPSIEMVTIQGNTALYGGGFYCSSATSLSNSTISTNLSQTLGDGIYILGGNPVFENNNYINNNVALYTQNNAQYISAQSNYWGHVLGPFHPTQNPTGAGDSTNQWINISPWLSSPNIDAPPIPAQNTIVNSSGNDYISLNWDSSLLGDFAGFKLYYDTDESGYPYANSVDVGSATSYTLSGLSLGTHYFLAVTAYDTDGNESWYSTEVTGTTRVMEVQNLDIAGDEDLQHLVTHNPTITFDYFDSMSETQTDYQIQISTDSTFQSGDIWDSGVVTSDATSVQYTEGLLENGMAYYLRAKVASGAFWSAWSNTSFRMNSAPSSPELLSPENGGIVVIQPTLRFLKSHDAEEDAIAYSVYLYNTETMITPLDSLVGYPGTTDTIGWTVSAALDDNAQHWWKVKSFDGYEYNTLTEVRTFLFNISNDEPSPFALISPIDESEVVSLHPLFSWHPATDVDPVDTVNYVLYLDTPAPGVETFDIGTDTSYQTVADLMDNTNYSWKVIASDLNGGSTENTAGYQSFRVNTENDLPTAFNLLAPEDESMVVDLTPTLVWEPSSDPDDSIFRQKEVRPIRIGPIRTTNSLREITAYQVYLDVDSLFTETVIIEVLDPEYTPSTDLLENMVYYWKVEAVDDVGGTLFSERYSFWTNAENEAPSEFSLLLPAEDEVLTVQTPTFTWEPSSDPDLQDGFDYNLVLGADPGSMDTLWSGTDTSFTLDWELDDNTTYFWSVFAEDWTGLVTSSTGGYLNFTVNTSNDLPVAFELLSPANNAMVATLQPEFLWEASSDPDDQTIALRETGKGKFSEDRSSGNNSVNMITGYDFYLGTDSLLTDVIAVGVFGTSYSPDTDLTENQVYYWAVSALDDSGGVTFSDTLSFWTNSENEAPAVFGLLLPTNDEVLSVLSPTFTWEPSSDPDLQDGFDYSLVLGAAPGSMDTLWSGSDTSLTLDWELDDNNTYYWSVFAEDWSGLVTFNTGGYQSFTVNQGNDDPSIVDLITPDSVMVLTLTPEMYWTPAFDADPGDVVSYEMHWWGDGIEYDSVLTDTHAVVLPRALADNSLYFWDVITMDQNGGISHSDEAFFWTNLAPEAPVGFALISPENDVTGLSDMPAFIWESAEDPDPMDYATYTLLIATDSSFSEVAFQTNTNADVGHEMTEALAVDTEYWWKVIATDTDSLTTESGTFKFTVGYVAIADAVELPTEYVLDQNYPNPFNPSTTLRYGIPEESSVSLTIYDIRGNTVKTFTSESKAAGWYEHIWNGFDDSGQPVSTGLYLTRLQAGSYSKVIKMLYLK